MKDVDETMQFLAACIYNLALEHPANALFCGSDDLNRLGCIADGYDPDVEEDE